MKDLLSFDDGSGICRLQWLYHHGKTKKMQLTNAERAERGIKWENNKLIHGFNMRKAEFEP